MSTETKTPQPGEWWQLKGRYMGNDKIRFYIIGKTYHDKLYAMRKTLPHELEKDSSEFYYGVIEDHYGIEHLPDCDGWDWQPPAEPPSNQDLFEMIVHLRYQMEALAKRLDATTVEYK